MVSKVQSFSSHSQVLFKPASEALLGALAATAKAFGVEAGIIIREHNV
ncbi:MAG: hypothetical protein WBE68_01225 [Candidatus Nitrosopolaris sp.]